MNYVACSIINGCSLYGNWSIAGHRHIVVTTHFDIVITTRVYVYLTIYGNQVYISLIHLYIYVGACAYLYIVIIAFGICFVYVNLVAAVYGNIRVALYLYLFFIT